MYACSRRKFLARTLAATAACSAARPSARSVAQAAERHEVNFAFGLVTYQWAKDWDLKTLIENCEQTRVLGVELRTTHAHHVEPSLSAAERREVRDRFADSPVTLVGLGSNERFDATDRATLRRAIETSKQFVRLSHDVGGTGVKVKPNSFHKGIPHERTIAQIARSLNELGDFGAGFGQQIRLEVHGQCAPLPIIKQIMDAADHPNVAICWNSNPQDLQGDGLEANFRLVCNRFGQTCHIHDLSRKDTYPYGNLLRLLIGIDYNGWVMLEEGKRPADPVTALRRQRELFATLVTQAAAK